MTVVNNSCWKITLYEKANPSFCNRLGLIKAIKERLKLYLINILMEDKKDRREVDELLSQCYNGSPDITHLLTLLRKYFSYKGTRDFIINYLFTVESNKLLVYMPQLVYMCLRYPPSFMKDLIQFKCSSSTEFFILVGLQG